MVYVCNLIEGTGRIGVVAICGKREKQERKNKLNKLKVERVEVEGTPKQSKTNWGETNVLLHEITVEQDKKRSDPRNFFLYTALRTDDLFAHHCILLTL